MSMWGITLLGEYPSSAPDYIEKLNKALGPPPIGVEHILTCLNGKFILTARFLMFSPRDREYVDLAQMYMKEHLETPKNEISLSSNASETD